MAAKRYELSAWDRLRLMRDKAEQLIFNINGMRTEEQLPLLTTLMGGALGEMCQLHIELCEIAPAISAAAAKRSADDQKQAVQRKN